MILITGAKGQLGTCLTELLPSAIAVDIDELDITNIDAVNRIINDRAINVIINCAAYTAVDKAEQEPEAAKRINALGAANLARSGAALVHISTDYVFDGASSTPYTETMPTCPASVYGRTKLQGEEEMLRHAASAIVLRTSWLYSPYGNNFVKTMRRLGAERDSLNVVFDQIGTPTSALVLARIITAILPQLSPSVKGVYHVSNEGVCSWYDFAVEIMRLSDLPCQVHPIESREYLTPATRPHYSVFNKGKIKSTFGIKIPHWRESLEECLQRLK